MPPEDDALELFFAAGRQAPPLDAALRQRLFLDAERVRAEPAEGAMRATSQRAAPAVQPTPAGGERPWAAGLRALAALLRDGLAEALGGRAVRAGLAAAGVAGLLLGFSGSTLLGLSAATGGAADGQLSHVFTLDDLEEMPDLLLADLVADGSFAADLSPAGAMP